MGEPLIKVVKFFLDDKTRGSKGAKEFDLEVYFKDENKAICSNVRAKYGNLFRNPNWSKVYSSFKMIPLKTTDFTFMCSGR